jgi:MoaA/NifB/PqqE/SkfB family radical SAM enzyme
MRKGKNRVMKLEKPSSQKEFTNTYNQAKVHRVMEDKYGEAYVKYREEWNRAENFDAPKYPIQLDFELNYSCNFSCAMCTWSVESSKNRGKETWMDIETFKRIVSDGVQKGLKAIRLNYINEPLIRKDIFEFIRFAKDIGIIDVYFSTNGSLLTQKVSESLIESGLDRLQVSIDAFSSATFEKIRFGGNLDKITKNIMNFLEVRKNCGSSFPLLRVNFVNTKENSHERDSFVEFWSEKADSIGVQNLVDITSYKSATGERPLPKFNCVQPYYHLTIRYDGTVLPCCTFYGAKLPIARVAIPATEKRSTSINLEIKPDQRDELPNRNIEEIWLSQEMVELRTIHANGAYWNNPVCKACVLSCSPIDETQSS